LKQKIVKFNRQSGIKRFKKWRLRIAMLDDFQKEYAEGVKPPKRIKRNSVTYDTTWTTENVEKPEHLMLHRY